MKKKIYGIFSIVMSSALAFSGCNGSGGNSSVNSSTGELDKPMVDITDSSLILDCLDRYELELELKNTNGITWSSSDATVVSVDENGVLVSKMKEGRATITATSSDGASDTCDVVVMVQGNPPAIEMENSIKLSEDGAYASEISITYNGQDILDYVTFEVNANNDYASATVDGNVITYTGVAVGTTEFSVYTTVFGVLYAEKVTVEVKNSDISYVVAGDSDKGLLLTVGKDVSVADVSVFYQGKKVPNDQLVWSMRNEEIATIGNDGMLKMGSEGETQMVAEYKGSLVVVNVEVIKLREYVTVENETLPYVNCDTTVVANLITYPNVGERILTVNETNEATLTLPGSIENGKVIGALVDGNALNASCFAYANGVLTIKTKVFGVDCYGEKTLLLFVEGKDTIYEYTVSAIIVTRSIKTLADFKTTISLGWQGDRILGYYTLASDIDCSGCPNGIGTYSTNWNYMDGFRATLDGAGYKLINVAACNYGITGQIGEGAVMKNLIFENVKYNGDMTGLFSRGAKNATFENITITSFDPVSTFAAGTNSADLGGLLVPHQVLGCTFKDITIHAEEFNLNSLIGGKSSDAGVSPNTYINVVVYAKSVKYFNYCSKTRPEGITVVKS